MSDKRNDLVKILKQQRTSIPLTLHELAAMSNVSSSHLGRIERGERFPSARILRKIAKPLGLDENYLFTLAGFLTPKEGEKEERESPFKKLDPIVATILAQESPETQRAIVGIISLLKIIARSIAEGDR